MASADLPKFKILTLGEAAVGKTNIIKRFAENEFSQNHLITIGVDWKDKEITVDGDRVIMNVWDTAGQESLRELPRAYYRKADGCFVVFDLTNPESFDRVQTWLSCIQDNTDNSNELSIMLIANKCDLNPVVSESHIKRLRDQFPYLMFFKTSAKSGENIDNAFMTIAKSIKERKIRQGTFKGANQILNEEVRQGSKIRMNQAHDTVDKKGCC